jgi:hypothetical protein
VAILGGLLIVWCKTPSSFQDAFWPNFWADMIVATVFGFALSIFMDLIKKPKLVLCVKQNGVYRSKILLVDAGNDTYKASFQFAIKNVGNRTFKKGEGYWYIYIFSNKKTNFDVPGDKYKKRQEIIYTIYPNSYIDLDFTYDLEIKKSEIAKYRIPYLFETDHGYFPKNPRIDAQTAVVNTEDVGHLELEKPSQS